MNIKSSLWSDMEIAQLKELAGTMSCPNIAAQIGRSADAVKNKINRLGLPKFEPAIHPVPTAKPVAYDPHHRLLVRLMVSVAACLASMPSEDRERAMRAAERAVQHLRDDEKSLPSPFRTLTDDENVRIPA